MAWLVTGANKSASFAPEPSAEPLTGAQMMELAASKDPATRANLAGNTELTTGLIITLSQDQKAAVRRAVAANSAVVRVASVVEALARDKDVSVVTALIRNSHVGDDVVEVIAASRRGLVRDDALRRLGRSGEEIVAAEGARDSWESEETITVTVEDPRSTRSRR